MHEAIIDKFDGKYHLCINGLGEYELKDISNFTTLAKGDKNMQDKMLEMLKLAQLSWNWEVIKAPFS